LTFAPGDTVVHPQHGTAVVTAVAHRDLGAGPVEYLEIFVEHAALKIMIPAAQLSDVGIRDVFTA
jgi:CarD family transcriptional regulator